jgi:hypothetical protein
MLAKHKSKTNVGIGLGFLLLLLGFVLCDAGAVGGVLACLLVLAGLPLLIWGCMHYAEGKGHSKWIGLVGLTGMFGLLVLVILPDLHKTEC